MKSVLEGVAFSLRDTFTIFRELDIPVERIRLGGGGPDLCYGDRFRPMSRDTLLK